MQPATRRVARVDRLGRIQVVDRGQRPDAGAIAAHRTPEGYLAVEGQISSVGVYEYSDGVETWGELRLPDHVFAPESMASFRGKPVTDDHPASFVGVDNWRDLARGNLGSNIRPSDDHTHVVADMLITDADLIRKIEAGKTQLSNGYEVVLLEQPGRTADGRSYRFVQTQILGNHNAVVDEARGGPTCALQLDSKHANAIAWTDYTRDSVEAPMKTITRDQFDRAACAQALAANAGVYSFTFKPNARGQLDAQLVIGDVVHELPDEIAQEILAQLSEPPKPEPGSEPAPDAEGDPKPDPEEEEEMKDKIPAVAPAGAPVTAPAPASVGAGKSITISLNAADAAQAQADALTAAVDERTEIVRAVERVCGSSEPTRGRTNADLMRAVVARVFDGKAEIAKRAADAKCSSEYLRCAYDSALQQHASAQTNLRARTFDALGAGGGSDLLTAIEQGIN